MPASVPLARRSIALIGLMGAGKSSIGRRLARRLALPFVDADSEIEAAAGLTIVEIFAKYGEAYFRSGERRVIARLLDGPRQVIAAGGGAFVDEATRALMRERCTTVWLDADVDTLVARVKRSDRRPLLTGRDPHQLLTDLAARRRPYYAEAHVRVRSEAGAPEHMVDRIVAALAAIDAGR